METPDIFHREDAMIRLGVGRNMVRAIRYWAKASGMIGEERAKEPTTVPTRLGLALFGENGWDPYLEDPGTLWLLHWKMCTNQKWCTTCYLIFCRGTSQEFSKAHVQQWLHALISKQGKARVTTNSLSRDIDVFIRTYTTTRIGQNRGGEDTLDCPLVELGLLREQASGIYSFVRGQHTSLPDWIFGFALAEFWLDHRPNQTTLSFDEIAYSEGAPGRVFKLDEASVTERLERLGKLTNGSWSFDETAGIRQLYVSYNKCLYCRCQDRWLEYC